MPLASACDRRLQYLETRYAIQWSKLAHAIRMERGIAGKVVARIGVLAIRWRLPSDVEIDTGFRADNRGEYDEWLEGEEAA